MIEFCIFLSLSPADAISGRTTMSPLGYGRPVCINNKRENLANVPEHIFIQIHTHYCNTCKVMHTTHLQRLDLVLALNTMSVNNNLD